MVVREVVLVGSCLKIVDLVVPKVTGGSEIICSGEENQLSERRDKISFVLLDGSKDGLVVIIGDAKAAKVN